MSDRAGTNRRSREQSASVALGGCDDEGNRTLRLVSVVEPSSPSDQIQWYVDGQPFGPAMAPGKYDGKVPGDGEMHLLELRVLSPEGVAGDRAEIKFPLCSQNLVGHIRSVDFAERQDDGGLPIRLVSTMEPEGTQATVQWLIDGEPVGDAVPAGVHTTSVEVAGGVHQVELRILEPEGAQGDLEEVEFPGPQVEARIAVAEFDDDDWDETESIAVAEFDEDDGLDEAESIAVAEFDEDVPEPKRQSGDQGPAEPTARIAIDSCNFDTHSVIQGGDKVEMLVSSSGQNGMATWSIDGIDIGGPVATPGTHTFSVTADGRKGALLEAKLQSPPNMPPGVDPLQGDKWSASLTIDIPGTPKAVVEPLLPDHGSFDNAVAEFLGNCIAPGGGVVHG